MSNVKVLIADDERDIRLLIRFPLSRRGIDVLEAADGAEAVKIARSQRPALILLDVMMPEIDGHEVCRTLRDDPSTADIPIVILSARGQATDIDTGLAAGADAYLVKPFQTIDLLEIVHRFTGLDVSAPAGPRTS